MSVLRIKAYHSTKAIEKGMHYVANSEKTSLARSSVNMETAYKGENGSSNVTVDLNAIHAFTYSTNPQKTNVGVDGDIDLLVSGVNCKPNTAVQQFMDDMNLYYATGHKENLTPRTAKRLLKVKFDDKGEPIRDKDGDIVYFEDGKVYKDPATGKCLYQTYMQKPEPRTTYMWVLSFPPAKDLGYEIDPRLVHQIGIEFCEKALSDYRCTVSTHMNTDCIHNHIMQCAYSRDGSHKYRDTMKTLLEAREIADGLSRRYGLPIILEPQSEKGMSWFEWKSRKEGQSWKEQVRQDIRDTISIANDFEDFKDIMRQSGYDLRETENHITYHLPGDKDRRCRDTMLNKGASRGEDYTKAAIVKQFEDRARPQATELAHYEPTYGHIVDPEEVKARHSSGNYVSRYTDLGRRRSDLEILLIASLKILKRFADRFSQKDERRIPQPDNPIYKPSAWKMQQVQDALHMVQELGIEDMAELERRMNVSGARLSHAKKQYKDLEVTAKAASDLLKKLDDAEDIVKYIQDIGLTIDDLHLYTYDEKEIRKHNAMLSPMSDNQRKTLYIELDKASLYKPRYKFDEITNSEGQAAIDFLQGRTSAMPTVLVDMAENGEDRLRFKYDKVFENRMGGMKNKYGDKPMTRAQEAKVKKILSGEEKGTDPLKLQEFQNVEIDTDKLSYYDAFRIINYFTPELPLSSPIADKKIRDKVAAAVAYHGDKLNRDIHYITEGDVRAIDKYYGNNKKGAKPDILKESEPASESEKKQCSELLRLRGIEISIPIRAITKDDAKRLSTALLLMGHKPEVLARYDENERLKRDVFFEAVVAGLPFEQQEVAIQARDMLNELGLNGIKVDNVTSRRLELENVIKTFEVIKEEYDYCRTEYKNLARLKYIINLASRKGFSYGPLYNDEPESLVEEQFPDRDNDHGYEQVNIGRLDRNHKMQFKENDSYFEKTLGIDI